MGAKQRLLTDALCMEATG